MMLEQNFYSHAGSSDRFLPDCEQTLLEGFRIGVRAIVTRESRHFDEAHVLVSGLVGTHMGAELSCYLTEYLQCLDSCRPAPLKLHPRGSKHLCRDEALMLSLVAGIQNGNETTVALCLDCLSCPKCSDRIFNAAEKLAAFLRLAKRNLLPVPDRVMRDILTRDISTNSLH